MTAQRKSDSPVSTQAAVFAAAARHFSAQGFDGTSVDVIAKEAGVNKAMIYYHFADKLAHQGMKFTDGYAACTVCSPTRAALMTGIRPSTSGVYQNNQPCCAFVASST